MKMELDGSTGGVLYAPGYWELIQTIFIKRNLNDYELKVPQSTVPKSTVPKSTVPKSTVPKSTVSTDEYSHAYLFKKRGSSYDNVPKFICVVNIHLNGYKFFEDTRVHINELVNIMMHIKHIINMFPIYFGGDYNNTIDKEQLIADAYIKYHTCSNA